MKLNKRSLLMIAAIVLCATMAIGSTLAYLTDTDQHVNTMVLGNVDIQQNEDFANHSLLMPAVKDENEPSGYKNAIQKKVTVENTGKNAAYVRTVFAFEMGSLTPAEFKDYVKPVFNANLTDQWNAVEPIGPIEINEQNYYMMSVTYRSDLQPGQETIANLEWVYLAPAVDRKEIEAVDGNGDGELTVIVLTQGVQVEGFADAETALNEAFTNGDPLGTTNHPWLNMTLDDIDHATYWYEKDPTATVFEINAGEQLAYFAELINTKADKFNNKTIKLTADIDMSDIDWAPINIWDPENSATLTIDGQNHSIKNLTIDGGSNAGFFGQTARALVIKDVTFENANVVTAGSRVGVVIGQQYGKVTLDNVDVKDSIILSTADKGIRLAGLIGQSMLNDGATLTVKNCDVSGTQVSGYHNIAGLVGTLMQYDVLTDKWTMTNNTVTGCTFNNGSGNEKYVSDFAVEGSAYPHKYDESNKYFENLGNTKSDNNANYEKVEKPTVTVATAAQLAAMLTSFTDAGSGDATINIANDITLAEGETWTPVVIDGYNGAGVVTINGNGHTISGLTDTLLAGGFAGNSGVVINDLTIKNANITSSNDQGYGAFINIIDSMPTITLNNCHLVNSTITDTKGARVGGLIGWTSGYNGAGSVKTVVTISNCSVTGCTIKANGSVGAIIGHAGSNAFTYHTITNCTVKNNTLTSTDDGGWRVGVVVGTANIGEVTISGITASGNTLSQTGKTAPANQSNLYGRFVPGTTGKLTIDGTAIK